MQRIENGLQNESGKHLALTMGDAAGIGPEIIVKAYREAPEEMRGCQVVGDPAVLRRAAEMPGMGEINAPLPPILHAIELQGGVAAAVPGQISAAAGRLAGECVAWAARAALRGEIAGLVTAPLHKEALAAAGTPWDAYPGHTELLQAEAAAHLGRPASEVPVRMMLANDELRTVLVSIHVALREAIEAVTFDNVVLTLRITDAALQPVLGRKPRIAVAGLNPHAGEGGRFGREEIEVIQPAVERARAEGLDVHGPFAPDTVFMRARKGEFDVVVAMYHDQGLIPVKYLGVEQGVNVTLGLPLVRTSPDHGTAFDIAGQGRADASSLIAAVRMAKRLAGLRV